MKLRGSVSGKRFDLPINPITHNSLTQNEKKNLIHIANRSHLNEKTVEFFSPFFISQNGFNEEVTQMPLFLMALFLMVCFV